MRPVINVADLKLDHQVFGERFESADKSFGSVIGLTDLGISYSEVPPGKSSCPFHNHHIEEELFLILDGEGTYRFGTERFEVRKGDVLSAPAGGPETAHQLLNTGSTTLRYIGISTNHPTEVVEYPDSGKFLVSSLTKGGRKVRFMGREQPGLDYWDGEKTS